MNIKRFFYLVSCLLFLAAGPVFAQERSADHEAITKLMWDYARALDTFNPEAYAAMYTEDGQFGTGENATVGREALHDYIAGLRDSRAERAANGEVVPPLYHMTTDSWTEFTGENTALHHSYWITMTAAAGDQPASVVAVGRGVDELVKVDGKWLIKVRNVAPQD